MRSGIRHSAGLHSSALYSSLSIIGPGLGHPAATGRDIDTGLMSGLSEALGVDGVSASFSLSFRLTPSFSISFHLSFSHFALVLSISLFHSLALPLSLFCISLSLSPSLFPSLSSLPLSFSISLSLPLYLARLSSFNCPSSHLTVHLFLCLVIPALSMYFQCDCPSFSHACFHLITSISTISFVVCRCLFLSLMLLLALLIVYLCLFCLTVPILAVSLTPLLSSFTISVPTCLSVCQSVCLPLCLSVCIIMRYVIT